MWEQFSLILEIIAGILLAIHFVIKRNVHSKIDKWLLNRLQRKITPRGHVRSSIIFFVGLLAFLTMITIAIWGFIKDYQGKAWPTGDLVVSYVLFVVAAIVGVLTISGILWIYNKQRLWDLTPTSLVILFSILIFIVCFLVVGITATTSVRTTSFLITYSFTTLITALWFGTMPFAQKYLTIKSGVLVRFGLALFIIAKIIQLKVAS